ncbi:50S ribosomal protein L25 [bacterium]|nr:50S ribosomal protein L25 [bacterium]|tara:strand:+ start:13950 stop:14540 length:591 start_codon:yes stop_codon:yes gene_type:complete
MTIELEYKERGTGKKKARALRKDGLIPAVVYGNSLANTSISITEPFIRSVLCSDSGKNTLIALNLAGTTHQVLIHEVIKHPITGKVRHLDFLCIDPKKSLTITVPLRFEGNPKGVKLGGLLLTIINEITVSCLPKDIPAALPVNIAHLGLEKALKISDIPLPNGVSIVTDSNRVVVKVAAPKGTKAEDIESSQSAG